MSQTQQPPFAGSTVEPIASLIALGYRSIGWTGPKADVLRLARESTEAKRGRLMPDMILVRWYGRYFQFTAELNGRVIAFGHEESHLVHVAGNGVIK